MSVFDGNESWLVQRRSGEIDDEFISITEQITIINNRGQFTEVPNDFNGVVIKSADNLITYSSKNSGIPTANVFIINYNQGIITADSSFNNVAINVSYKGTGKFLLSSERVYTKQENGIVLETLQEIVDNATPILESEEARNDAEIIRVSQEENRQSTYSSGHINFKGVVTGKTSLPSSSNLLGDTYQVINDVTTSNNAMWRYNGTIFEKAYVLDLTFAGGYGANDSQVFTATANQTLFTLTNFPYLVGVNQLLVMISGIKQTIGSAYTETSTNSFTLSEGVPVGTKVEAFRSVPGGAGSITTQEVENARVSSLGVGYENLKARLDDHDSNKVGVLANLPTVVKTDIVGSVTEIYNNALSAQAKTTNELLAKRDISTKILSSDLDISSQATKIQPINISDALMEMFSPAGTVSPVIPLKSVGLDKMSVPLAKAVYSKNVFDKSSVVTGYYVEYTNGELVPSATRSAIRYIPCLPNTAYTKYDNSQMAFYDVDKVYISGVFTTSGYNFTTPVDCAYMGIGVLNTLLDVYQIEVGTYPRSSEYENFASKVDSLTLKNDTIDKYKMSYPVLVGVASKNAVNVDELIPGFYCDYLTGILVANALYSTTRYIPVIAGQQWVKNNDRHVAFYDAKKGRVGGIALGTSAITYTIPVGTVFQRTSVLTADANTFQVELGSIATDYVSGKPTVDPISLPIELFEFISVLTVENEEWMVE